MRALILILFLLAAADPLHAHGMSIFATLEGDTIEGHASMGSRRIEGAAITIRETGGPEVFRGQTDPQGSFSWRTPGPGSWILTIDARDGHAASATVSRSEPAPPAPDAGAALDLGEMEKIIDRSVARQIRPLREAYADAESRIRFNDVVGGIGMIIGLAGVALWISARRSRPDR